MDECKQCFVIVIIVIIVIVVISGTHGLTHFGRAMCTQHNKHLQHTIITQLPCTQLRIPTQLPHNTKLTKLTKCLWLCACLFGAVQ